MQAAVSYLQQEFGHIRPGRAAPSMLDSVIVGEHRQMLKSLASVSVKTPTLLQIAAFESANIPSIESAVKSAQPSLSITVTAPGILSVSVPKVTSEQRQQLAKQAHQFAEHAKVSVRNVRRDAMAAIQKKASAVENNAKEAPKEAKKGFAKRPTADTDTAQPAISKDELKRMEKAIQSMTDAFVEDIDQMFKDKEKDILSS